MEQFREVVLPELSGGLNTRDPEYGINDNQSPDMLNMWYKDKALTKRPGQELFISIPNVYRVSDVFNGDRCFHAGNDLYRLSDEEKLTDGDITNSGAFVEFGRYLYYLDGVNVWRISPDYTVDEPEPYIPVVMINATPDGSGDSSFNTDNEAYNLIGAGFTVHFNGNGTSTTYQLPQDNLDDATVKVVISASDKTEGTHFTVNRAAGTVNFAGGSSPHGAPAASTNNVWITAYKTVSGNKGKITKCKYGTPYGGETAGVYGGTRVFLMGNPDYPYHYWRSDLSVNGGMLYWPYVNEEMLDQNSQAITGCQKMGEYLIILKENSAFAVGYSFDGEEVYYPVVEIHSTIGCDAPGSVQLVDNKLVFLNTKSGVYIMTSYSNQSESTVKPLSANVNPLLLGESGLSDAVSIDHDQYYWLCVNGNAYVWDYGSTPYYNMSDYDKAQKRLAWFRFDNINPTCMFADSELYYGSANGIVRFTWKKNDFGQPYKAYFKSKAFDLGEPNKLKTFFEVFPSFSTDGNILATVTVANEDKDEHKSNEYDIRSFDLSDLNLEAFTLRRIKFAETHKFKVKMKKSVYIQIIVSGDAMNRGVGISGLKFTYVITREVKR